MSDEAQRLRKTIWQREYESYEVPYNCSLPEFMAALRKVADDVPDDDLHNVIIDFVSGDSCVSGHIELEYGRDETDEEMAERLLTVAEKVERARLAYEANERRSLAYLQAKYGKDGQPPDDSLNQTLSRTRPHAAPFEVVLKRGHGK